MLAPLRSLILVLASLNAVACGAILGEPAEITGKATGDLAPGSRVGARQDGTLMLAEVVRAEGDTYVVKFANHVTGSVNKADILPIAAPGSLKVGDRVLALRDETRLWQADVAKLAGATAVVVFDGSSEGVVVPQDRVAHLPAGFCDPKAGCMGSGATQADANAGQGVAAPVETDPFKALKNTFKLGDQVIVQFAEVGTSNHFEWRLATVSGRLGDALVVQIPGQAEPKNGFPSDLRPVRAPKRPLAVGTTVLWALEPGRYVEIWIAGEAEPDGTRRVVVYDNPKYRAGEGGDERTLTQEQLTAIAAFDPADF